MTFKNDPTSCHNKAYEDEPVFTLRAKDPSCSTIIREWVADRLLRAFAQGELTHPDPKYDKKLREALSCAEKASDWWYENEDRNNDRCGTPE